MQSDRATLCAHWFTSSVNDFTIARDYRERIPIEAADAVAAFCRVASASA